MTILRKRLKAILVRHVDRELLLLDTDSNQIHQLNPTARFVWQVCDQDHSSEEMAGMLAAEFEVEYDVALKDVVQTLEKLRELHLIVSDDLSQ